MLSRFALILGAWLAGAGLAGCPAPAAAQAWRLSRLDAPPALLDQALAQAGRQGLAHAVLVREQSFALRAADGPGPMASVLSLRGRVTTSTGDNAACGLVLVGLPSGAPQLLLTVGSGAWEAQACLGVEAVGLVRGGAQPASGRLAVVYRAASPNAATLEPVVLRWDRDLAGFAVDPAATASASQAGATTIKAIAAALK